MRKTLLFVLSVVIALATGSATGQVVSARAQFKSPGRSLAELAKFRAGSTLKRIPSKAELYGPGNVQIQGETSPSVAPFDFAALSRAPRRAAGERTARALLIFNDSEKATNRIIEMPITPGAVSSFNIVAERVPKMPYKNYGEAVVTAIAYDNQFMASTFCSMLYSQTNSVYTTADWVHQYDYDYRVADLEATSVAYNPADGMAYGVFQGINPATGEDEWFFGRWIDPSSYTIPEPISWLGTEARWFGMAISPQGVIYVIDGECNLLKVDKSTGDTTLIGATGLTNQYKTSACYDAVNDRILFATCLDQGSTMNSIDPATGRASMLYPMPDGEQVLGLFIPDPEAADKAPAAALNLKVDFPLGSLTGNVCFDVPDTYFDGTKASGTVNYEVCIDGSVAATGTASYGASVKAQVTVENSSMSVVTVRLSNSAGLSPITRDTMFCGTPRPRVPYYTKYVTYNEDEKCFEIAWEPNRDNSGMTGGAVVNDDLTYELVRFPDKKVITTDKGVLSIKDPYTPASENIEVVYYELYAVYHGAKSYASRSNPTTFGHIIPPFADEMWNSTSAAYYSYISTTNDKNAWSYIGAVTQQDKQHGWMNHGAVNSSTSMDSYLVLAPVKLQRGKVYTMNFTAACTNTSWRNEKVAVYMGTEPTPQSLRKKTLMQPTYIYERREENGERHSCNISVDEDGLYYIAFHHCSEPNKRFLYIGDISISAPLDGLAPAEVDNLQVSSATGGVLQAFISFQMPVTSVNGNALTEATKVRIYRGEEQIADLTPMGKSVTYTDHNAVNGVNNYVIVPYNSKGDGMKSTANVFVGVGKPFNPAPRAWYGNNDGESVVTWGAVKADEFGTPLNENNVRYEVQRESVLASGNKRELVGENIRDTRFTEQYCSPDAEQSSAAYWVRAVTDGGVSQWVSTRKLGLGKPYTTPWIESFAGGECEYNWHAVGSSMNWSMPTDDVYDDVKSVDGDNGFMLCQTSQANSAGLLYSGAIQIPTDIQDPVLSFYYLDQGKYQGVPVKNFVELVIISADGQKHVKSAICNGTWGWKRMTCDMSEYKGQKVQVGVYLECIDRPFMAFDAFRLATRLQRDFDMVRITGPEEVTVGENAVLTVEYENLGALDIPAGYKVQLYQGDRLVDEMEGKALAADSRTSVNFTVKTNPTLGNKVTYHAVVKYDDDMNPDNNASNEYTLKINNNVGYPEPLSLKAERTDEGVAIQWTAPDMSKTPRETYTETFESFDSFAKEIPGWVILDEDKGVVAPISSYIQTSETWGSPFGFFVMDNTVTPFDQYEEFLAASGHKYMASQLVTDQNGNGLQNDDWLISPELSGHAQTASFLGKSISAAWPESFEVYYSTTGTAKEDFTMLGGVIGAPNAWVNYTVNLPEGARYFAIRCNSMSCLQFMVDDVTLRLMSCPPIELTFKGYNVYCDNTLLNAEPISTLNYVDTGADGREHSYMVTAVYEQGESMPSEASIVTAGIDAAATGCAISSAKGLVIVKTADDRTVEIYNTAGTCIHRQTGSCRVPVAAGVYVVKAGPKTAKVIVD